jgi:4-alpha-glucanotransferase
MHQEFGRLPLVAEDLGIITPEVEALRRNNGLPGMKVLQFAFSGGADNPYLPFRHSRNSVVYTGTHDNDTTVGWYRGIGTEEREAVEAYLGYPRELMPWPLIRCAMGSRAGLAIIPMQDILSLGSEHRMNLPGTTEDNWDWQFTWEQLSDELVSRLRACVELYGRA